MPFLGTRRFDVHVKRAFMNDFSNRRGSNEEPEIDDLAAKQVYEFAFVMQPLKTQGFTVAPVAIR